jgi:hypothetical protein
MRKYSFLSMIQSMTKLQHSNKESIQLDETMECLTLSQHLMPSVRLNR